MPSCCGRFWSMNSRCCVMHKCIMHFTCALGRLHLHSTSAASLASGEMQAGSTAASALSAIVGREQCRSLLGQGGNKVSDPYLRVAPSYSYAPAVHGTEEMLQVYADTTILALCCCYVHGPGPRPLVAPCHGPAATLSCGCWHGAPGCQLPGMRWSAITHVVCPPVSPHVAAAPLSCPIVWVATV